MSLNFWKEPEIQTVASWGDLAVLVVCAIAAIAFLMGWIS